MLGTLLDSAITWLNHLRDKSASPSTEETWSLEEVPDRFAAIKHSRSADEIQREAARVREKMKELLPLEIHLKARCEAELECLKAEETALARRIDEQFKRLDMGFMRLNKGKHPTFAMFDMNGPYDCTITLTLERGITQVDLVDSEHVRRADGVVEALGNNYIRDGDRIRQVLCSHYLMGKYANLAPVTEELRYHSGWTIRTAFSGVIPDDVRCLFNEVKECFDQVVLVAEVDNWQESVRPGDPLLIGRIGHLWWLISKFDTTPLEEYASKEFTTEM
jgi:hypothetical protein